MAGYWGEPILLIEVTYTSFPLQLYDLFGAALGQSIADLSRVARRILSAIASMVMGRWVISPLPDFPVQWVISHLHDFPSPDLCTAPG